jgi:hypothetical protein
MYMEGSTKAFVAVIFAILLVLAITFWPQTKFLARFSYDLARLNLKALLESLIQYILHHWPFVQSSL